MIDVRDHAWIFLSHAGADLPVVRRVRNYLEEKGASPLLFHLMALKAPEEFWPIIEKEIEARNFFLLCDSPNARKSEWVQREREAVERVSAKRSIRVQSVEVGGGAFEPRDLDVFLNTMRVYVSRDAVHEKLVQPYLLELRTAGFEVTDFEDLADDIVGSIQGRGGAGLRQAMRDHRAAMARYVQQAAERGWIVVFLCAKTVERIDLRSELAEAVAAGARIVPVYLDPPESLPPLPELTQNGVLAFGRDDGPKLLRDLLLTA